MRPSRSNARDANEGEIVAALVSAGASVRRLDEPTDLLVGFRRENFLLEVKLPLGPKGGASHSKPTDAQIDFFRTWRGSFSVVRTPTEALEAIGLRVR